MFSWFPFLFIATSIPRSLPLSFYYPSRLAIYSTTTIESPSLLSLSLSLSRVAYMVCLGFFNSHLWSVWIGRSVRRRGKRDMRRFTLPHVGFATSVLTLWVMTEHKYLLHVFVSLIIIIIISMSLVFYYSINIYLKEPAFFSVSLIN